MDQCGMVWLVGFAPTTSGSRSRRSSELSYSQMAPQPGFEPGYRESESRVLPVTPPGNSRIPASRTPLGLAPNQVPNRSACTRCVGVAGVEPAVSRPPAGRLSVWPHPVMSVHLVGLEPTLRPGKNRVTVHMAVRCSVPETRVELARPFSDHPVLSRRRLPFRHSGNGWSRRGSRRLVLRQVVASSAAGD